VDQYAVIKQISLILGRMLETSVSEAVGTRVPVAFEYTPEARQGSGSLSLIFLGLERRSGNLDREYEVEGGAERFRNPPLLLRARYLVSAWARPPEDQALLGATLRTFLDNPHLSAEGEEEERVIGYAGVPSVDLAPVALDEHRELTQALGIPMAPSMSYWVDFRLQSGKVTPIKRVKERVIDFRKIDG